MIKPKYPVDTISYSDLILFTGNPVMFKIKKINKEFIDSLFKSSGLLGSAVHKALEVYYGGTDDFVPETESEAIEAGLKAGMKFIEEYPEEFIEYTAKIPTKAKIYEMFAFSYNTYIRQYPFSTDSEVLQVEAKLQHKIDVIHKGEELRMPIPLKGYIDKIERKDEVIKIFDYKTTQKFSDPDKIDGAKILQAVEYYFLVLAEYGQAPYSMTYQEIKVTKNKDGSPQIREYEIVYEENDLYFDFYLRYYFDVVTALSGQQVYVPNIGAFYDNEIALISYIHRLDVDEERAKLFEKHKVKSITELLTKKLHSAKNIGKLMDNMMKKIQTHKTINYEKMTTEEKIKVKLMEHGVIVNYDGKVEGCSIDVYKFLPSVGMKMTKIKAYNDDIEQVLGKSNVRILAPMPNSVCIGIEVPKEERTFPTMPSEPLSGFDVYIGKDLYNQDRVFDLREGPHMLVAGASGSGKSVFLNSLINQLAQKKQTKLYLYDPKRIELQQYEDVANQFFDDEESIALSLMDLVSEMERRYKELKKLKKKNIEGTDFDYIFAIIDEFGDLSVGEYAQEIETSIQKLSQKARAAGIHLIITTQRPSTDVVKGTIKANFPVKVMFKASKAVDSTVLLDEVGGEKLLGKGDMLFYGDKGLERLQGYNV